MLNLQDQYKQELANKLDDDFCEQIRILRSLIENDDVEHASMTLRHIISQLSSVGDDMDYYRYVTYKELKQKDNVVSINR